MDWEGGGGFMNDSIVGEPQQLSNNVSVGVEERSKAVASVSVSVISKLTRPDGGLIIHGKKIYHVKLIAFISEILDNNSQKIHILVDDYTAGGPIEVSHVIGDTGIPSDDFSMYPRGGDDMMDSPNHTTKELHALQVGDYVRCVGVVKYNQDQPNVVAYHIEYVDDPNYITTHCLEVIHDSMFLEKNQSSFGSSMNTGFGGNVNNTSAPAAAKNNNNEFGRLSNREKLVLKFVRERTDMANDRGVNIREIVDSLKALQRKDIEDSLNTLNAEGLCWQGDNEEVWHANASD